MVQESDLLQGLEEITPIPGALLRLTELVTQSDYSLTDVVEIVELDPGMTADVLRFANSALSASISEISSIKHAVTRMGAKRISEFLMSKWLRGRIDINQDLYGITSTELWKHCIVVAMAAKLLGEARGEQEATCYSAGLLHDMGKVVLSYLSHKLGIEMDHHSYDELENQEMIQMEQTIFGVDHAEAGAMLLQKWKLPDVIWTAVLEHENPEAPANFVTDSVRVGNMVYLALQEESEADWKNHYIDTYGARVGLDADAFVHLCFATREKSEEILALYA